MNLNYNTHDSVINLFFPEPSGKNPRANGLRAVYPTKP